MENNDPFQKRENIEGEIADLTVLIPAYGETDNLRLLLPFIKETIKEMDIKAQVIVVDTASPIDDTADVCLQNQVICLPRKNGNNYGDALRTGIDASIGDYVVVMDADGSHNPGFISTMWTNRLDYDLIIASRYIRGGHTDNPWPLVFLSRVLNITFKLFVGLPVLDVSNSYRLYRGNYLRKLKLTSKHFDIMEEILAKIIWKYSSTSAKILELPLQFEKRKSGKSKRNLIIFGLNFLSSMWRLRRLRILIENTSRSETLIDEKFFKM